MKTYRPVPNSSVLTYKIVSGERCLLILESEILILEHPAQGILKELQVRIKYQDGLEEELSTDTSGRITLKRNHGGYIDIELTVDSIKYDKRYFIFPEDINSEDGVWQRLVNLGYVLDDKPAESAETSDVLAYYVANFQADHGLIPDGIINDRTKRLIEDIHDLGRSSESIEERDANEFEYITEENSRKDTVS